MVGRGLWKCKFDLVSVQEVRWEKGGTEQAQDYTFLYGERNENHKLGTGFFIQWNLCSRFLELRFSRILCSFFEVLAKAPFK
jgi:hypothetical protein